MKEIEIYTTKDQKTEISVQFEEDTVWLTQSQMADLFMQTKQNVSLHINNCFKEQELDRLSVVKDFLTTAADGKRYNTKHYNLEVIISVGYRVKSKRGTQFRQWATERLKDYLVQGYAINEKRLEEKQQQVMHLKTGIRILSRAIGQQATGQDNEILQTFANGLQLLDDFDHEQLDAKGNTEMPAQYPDVREYLEVINNMKSNFASDVFARPKDSSFESSVQQIQQSFDNRELYASIEEKAAMLLYLIVKNHSFVDGNKRIAAACFIYFLDRNKLLFFPNQQPVISNEALAALTLFVATSRPDEMETVKQFIMSILNRSE
ncbi:MAG: death-on-curing protein [Bacteroidetes bacterium 43-16]|nr:MAG: death-on-curing protein [Bacteroidetes bacterium 43-16]